MLAHELAHIRRHDYLVNLLQMYAETLLFYHPAVWWVSARMRHERELCCDDLAVGCCGDALCYARALTTLERMRVTTPELAMGAHGGSMLYRIERLLGGARETAPSKLPGILALALGLACFALNVHWAHGQEPRQGSVHVMTGAVQDSPGVSVDLGGAQVLHRSGVEYPGFARERHIEGTIVTEVTLDANGAVSDARILSGPQEMRRSALRTVLDWHFAGASAGNKLQVRIQYQNSQAIDSQAPNIGVAVRTEPGQQAESMPEQARLQREVARLREDLEESRAAKLQQQQSDPAAVRLENEQRMALLRQTIENLARARERQAEVAGRKLKSIAIIGLGETAQKDLMSRLSLHVGDTLPADSLQTITATARQFDPRLEVGFTLTSEGLVELGIFMPGSMAQRMEPRAIAGRIVKSVNIFGLEEASKSDLLARIPLHAGDTLAADSLQTLTAAARQFDEHLEVGYNLTADGQVEFRITAPGAGGRQFLFLNK